MQRLLDLRRPFAVLLVALLHFVPDDREAAELVRVLREALPPGGYLVLAHAMHADLASSASSGIQAVYQHTLNPMRPRTAAQIAAFVDGLELVPPSLVYVPLWRPESDVDLLLDQPQRSSNLGAVGRQA